ncbi:MAG TPA: aminotransferase class I/II-fold pyridoxal phosphate-dependent enzyme [Limnochordia bacterium]|nr:aminotransferase class I/II-fold pyridoxal phosphate-dependent enzyme [Limnochordia bacterium]
MERLAIHGGPPVRTKPWVSKYMGSEELGAEEKSRVLKVLEKKRIFRYLPDGLETSEARALEEEYKAFLGTKFALAVNSGTSALICALIAAGVGPGHEVIIPAYTWVATAAAVAIVGAVPVLAEVDSSLTLDPRDFAAKITSRTKAVIVVHMRGIAADMDPILEIAQKHGLMVIEDVAQANGGTYKGRLLGSLGHVGCFSLQQSKVIASGEGGMLVTNSEELWQRAVLYHDGAGYQFRFTERKIPAFPGQNYRLTELQAALCLGQLEKMPAILRTTRENKRKLVERLGAQGKIELSPVFGTERDLGVSLIFYVSSEEKARQTAQALTAEGIPAFQVYDRQARDQHIYINWEFLLAKRDPWGGNFPWSLAPEREIEYSEETCPFTLDLLSRAVQIHLNHLVRDEDLRDIEAAVGKVAFHLL